MAKQIITILLVLAALFCTVPMRGEDPPEFTSEIPVKKLDRSNLFRSPSDIYAFYDGMSSVIYTIVRSDIGLIEMNVTNHSTGEFWMTSFDSSNEQQSFLQISGTPGCYEIEYITESGDIYEGTFLIE